MTIDIEWERGGRGQLVETDGQFVKAWSEVAAAPGTPLACTARIPDVGPLRYEIKVRGCRRISDSPVRFHIDGRFMNLSSGERRRLLSLLGAPDAPAS